MDTNHTSCTIKETQEGHMEHWQSTLYSRHCWPWRQVSLQITTLHRVVSLLLFFLGFWWSCWMMASSKGRPFEAHTKKKDKRCRSWMVFFVPNMRIPDPHICFSKKDPGKMRLGINDPKGCPSRQSDYLRLLQSCILRAEPQPVLYFLCLISRIVVDVPNGFIQRKNQRLWNP